jgi:hypothetical protein
MMHCWQKAVVVIALQVVLVSGDLGPRESACEVPDTVTVCSPSNDSIFQVGYTVTLSCVQFRARKSVHSRVHNQSPGGAALAL